ncbi:MAG: hypothetical protein H7832_11020 [Magnetococcus sp. DMHC-6]
MVKTLFYLFVLRPNALFTRMRVRSLLGWAIVLQTFRWFGTALTTIVTLYYFQSPMLLPVPFGIDPTSYRLYEIFAYGPYGLLIISAMAHVICVHGAPYATLHPLTFAKCWELLGFTFFGPWLPSFLIDSFLVALGWGGPQVIIPWHVSIVGLEAILTIVGLQAIFGLPMRVAITLGGVTGGMFLVLAGVVIR